jgi:hypothetical protein
MKFIFGALIIFFVSSLNSQCTYSEYYNRKVEGIDYTIHLNLDTELKQANCQQVLRWTNNSPDTLSELRFYMYLNAFRDMNSTFLSEASGKVFGRKIRERRDNEWGSIDISECVIKNQDHISSMRYIQPDDDNPHDKSVLSITLNSPLYPGEVAEIKMIFVAKLPKIIARAGYSRDNYYLFVHWFPQPGVYEQTKKGFWEWNCHQFMQKTEFYADFGNYDVSITAPKEFIIGGSGCIHAEKENLDGTKTTRFIAKDVIDFAWSAYPLFEEYRDSWKGIEIRLLIPPEHCKMAPRYNQAIKNALDYFEQKLEKYPYPSITLVDPPMHALRSGFMEYPMHITCASFFYIPEGIRTVESLAIHEFSHMYYMAILASNEKEEPWLDEGLVTYTEDVILDNYYGDESSSLFDILGYKLKNRDKSRLEYTSMDDPNCCAIARPGWEFTEGVYKEIIYAKTATVLQTLKGIIGSEYMDKILSHYYRQNKFTHPREKDFIASVKAIVGDSLNGYSVNQFFNQCLHETVSCDFYLSEVTENSFVVRNKGDLKLPVDIHVIYKNGNAEYFYWEGQEKEKTYVTHNLIESVYIDPAQKIYLDLNLNNNSFTTTPDKTPIYNYAHKAMTWLQNVMLSTSFIF